MLDKNVMFKIEYSKIDPRAYTHRFIINQPKHNGYNLGYWSGNDSDDLFSKTASNIEEVSARGAKIILISDKEGINKLSKTAHITLEIPHSNTFILPILYSIPVQMLAYHTAVAKGTDVDQPRNLAKSVTVE